MTHRISKTKNESTGIRPFSIIKYLLYLLIAVFILTEIILRLWDPFEFRQGDKNVILPRHRKMVFTNTTIPVLDKKIIHTKNSLGFRGPELPKNFNEVISIVAVGGSTTECFYLSDSMCWTNLLSRNLRKKYGEIWINNAGFQGHSTYGNFILINDYIKKIRPRYVLLMEGMNEINRTDIKKDESIAASSRKTSAWGWIKRNSRAVDAVINIQRRLMADRLGVTDTYFDPAEMGSLLLTNQYIDSALKTQMPLADAYSKRLHEIIDTCLANNIRPVLITQPIMYGRGSDCVTGTDLSSIKIADGYNGKLFWSLLEMYNEKTRKAASDKDLLVIDLANELPGCSKYFYDVCHFTNQGSAKVSEILYARLVNYFPEK